MVSEKQEQGKSKGYYLGRLPAYLLNNLVTVITLCVKAEYPVSWPNAFEQLLQVSSANIAGLDFVVRFLTDLDREIVSFGREEHEEIAQTAKSRMPCVTAALLPTSSSCSAPTPYFCAPRSLAWRRNALDEWTRRSVPWADCRSEFGRQSPSAFWPKAVCGGCPATSRGSISTSSCPGSTRLVPKPQ